MHRMMQSASSALVEILKCMHSFLDRRYKAEVSALPGASRGPALGCWESTGLDGFKILQAAV